MVRIPLVRAPLAYAATRYHGADLVRYIRASCIASLCDVGGAADGQLHYKLDVERKIVVLSRSGRSTARLTVDLKNGFVTHNLAYFQRPGSSGATLTCGDVPAILSERADYPSYNDFFHVLEDWWSALQTYLTLAHTEAPRLAEIRGKKRGGLDAEVLGDEIWRGKIDWASNRITVPSALLPLGRRSARDQTVYTDVCVTYLGDRPLPGRARRKERVAECRHALVLRMNAAPEGHSGVREEWWRALSKRIIGLRRAEYAEAWLAALAERQPGKLRWGIGGRPRGSRLAQIPAPAKAPRTIRRDLDLARRLQVAERARINPPAGASVVNASDCCSSINLPEDDKNPPENF